MSFKYNPGFMSDEEIVTDFVVRKSDLSIVLEVINDNEVASSNRHVLIVGPRGAGKTTLVRRIAAEVNNVQSMSEKWHPLVLAEESYTATTAGEFWLECVFQLASQTGDKDLRSEYEELSNSHDEYQLQESSLGILIQFSKTIGKRILLVVENLNMIFDQQLSDNAGWSIRHTLQNCPEIMLIGTATTRFDEIQNIEKALFEQFKTHDLLPLTASECAELWEHSSGESVPKKKIRPIQILTGGSPRLIKILAEFSSDNSLSKLMSRLTHVIDQYTDYFKSQLESLPSAERKVFVCLLDLWDPATTKEIAAASRISVNTASALLNRLKSRGAVSLRPGKPRRWEATERLLNIYYLMRRRSGKSNRVLALVKFMTVYYEDDQLFHRATRIANEACALDPKVRDDHYSTLAQIIPHFDGDHRTELMEWMPPEFKSRLADEGVILSGIEGHESTPPKPKSDDEIEFSKLMAAENFEAAEAFLHSKPSEKGDQLLWLQLCMKVLGDGKLEKAVEFLNIIGSKNDSDLIPKAIAAVYMAMPAPEHTADAITSIHKAIEQNPKDWENWSLLGEALIRSSQYEESIKALLKAKKLYGSESPPNSRLWTKLGEAQIGLELLEDAASSYRTAAELSPEDEDHWGRLGSFLLRGLKDPIGADEAFRKIINLNSKSKRGWLWLARTAKELGRPHPEIDEYYCNAESNEVAVSLEHASYLDSAHQHEEATALVDRVVESNPDSFEAAIFKAQRSSLLTEVDRDTVLEQFERAIELDPNSGRAWSQFGSFLSKDNDRKDEAENALKKGTELSPESCGPWYELGEFYSHCDNKKKSRECFLRALEENNNCSCALQEISQNAIDDADDSTSAIKALTSLENQFPTNPMPNFALGSYLAHNSNDSDGARAQLLLAVDKGLDPEAIVSDYLESLNEKDVRSDERDSQIRLLIKKTDPGATLGNSIAWSILEEFNDTQLIPIAIDIAREAFKAEPESWAIQHTLATALARSEDPIESMGYVTELANNINDFYLNDFVDLCISLAKRGFAKELLENLSDRILEADLEPLLMAIKMKLGEPISIAKEILEVAKDILKRMD